MIELAIALIVVIASTVMLKSALDKAETVQEYADAVRECADVLEDENMNLLLENITLRGYLMEMTEKPIRSMKLEGKVPVGDIIDLDKRTVTKIWLN